MNKDLYDDSFINNETSNYSSVNHSSNKSSKNNSKIDVESRNEYSEFEGDENNEELGVLESQQSGNPFDKKSKYSSKRSTLKVSISEKNEYQDDGQKQRKKGSSRKFSIGSSSNNSVKKEKLSTLVNNGDSKSMDRNLAKVAQDPQNTIMTAHEPKYHQKRLDVDGNNKQELTQWDEKDPSQITSNPNIRVSTHCSNKNASQLKRNRTPNKSVDNEFPAINNNVVDESLPFQGLDNHTYYISQEGFSGARATYYNNPGNVENQNTMHNNSYNPVNQSTEGFNKSRENLASRKSSSILMKKLNQNKNFNEDNQKPQDETAFNRFNRFGGGNGSESSAKPLDHQLKSMPRLRNSKYPYDSNPNRDIMKQNKNNIHSNLIPKFKVHSGSEYEGVNDIQNNPHKGHQYSKSYSQTNHPNLNFPNQSTKNLSGEEKRKLQEMMTYFNKNPESLLELVPENSNFQFSTGKKSRKTHSKRGQCMIPDLGIVPPQSGHIGLKHNDNGHNRKKSHGDVRQSNRSFQRHLLNPTIDQFDKNNSQLKTIQNMKPSTAKEAAFLEYNSPNFMPNIQQKMNNTAYQARLSELKNRGFKSNSISQQKDTTILDKKSIVIDSETEEVVQENVVNQSQAIQMQNTINLVSESESEASTKKRSKEDEGENKTKRHKKKSKEELKVIHGKETHKRSKNSKLQEVVQEESASKNDKRDIPESKILGEIPESKILGEIPESKILGEIPVRRRNPSDLTREIEEVGKDRSQEGKSVSDIVDSSSKNKDQVQEKGKVSADNKEKSDKIASENSPSNDTSLHQVNADEKSLKNIGKVPSQNPLKLTNKASHPDSMKKSDENANTLRKIGDNPKEEAKYPVSEKDNSEDIGIVYVKQTIESFRDSQHSKKLDEKEVNYKINVGVMKAGQNNKTPSKKHLKIDEKLNEQSFKPAEDSSKEIIDYNKQIDESSKEIVGSHLERIDSAKDVDFSRKEINEDIFNVSLWKSKDIFEVDLDTVSNKSILSRKSQAISVMREGDIESKKSEAISVMHDEDLRSRKSVGISVQQEQK